MTSVVSSRIVAIGVALVLAIALPHCQPSYRPGLPPDSPFADSVLGPALLSHGVAVGDVTSRTALVWLRTNGPGKVQVEWQAEESAPVRSPVIHTAFQDDFTARIALRDLQPGRIYRYVVLTGHPEAAESELRAPSGAEARFTTPADDRAEATTFVWGGDLGGQQHCRRQPDGYAIFNEMLRVKPDFAIILGDTIYADEACTAPPNEPGSEFVATTLEDYRAKHRYQREDQSLQRFLANVPVYPIWDDHEVRNNFSGPSDPLMPVGRQAFLEYWPVAVPAEQPFRLYRNIKRGNDVELFILDTRQYRSENRHEDRPGKTMLGAEQRTWLEDRLARSTAMWKFVVTSVPLSNPKGGSLLLPGNDSWARGADGTGFLTELRAITDALCAQGTQNVIWLAGDVHYAQANVYDPDGDGQADFHEFISGPLSARPGRPVDPNPDLGPTTLYSEGGFTNFGVIRVEGPMVRVAIMDAAGTERFVTHLEARPHSTLEKEAGGQVP